MAKKLFTVNQLASDTEEPVFTALEDQIIFIELWNETEKPAKVSVKVGDQIISEGVMEPSEESHYAHSFHQVEIKKGEEVKIAAQKNSIIYNIIL